MYDFLLRNHITYLDFPRSVVERRSARLHTLKLPVTDKGSHKRTGLQFCYRQAKECSLQLQIFCTPVKFPSKLLLQFFGQRPSLDQYFSQRNIESLCAQFQGQLLQQNILRFQRMCAVLIILQVIISVGLTVTFVEYCNKYFSTYWIRHFGINGHHLETDTRRTFVVVTGTCFAR